MHSTRYVLCPRRQRCSGLMPCALYPGSNGLGSSPGLQGHCVEFLVKTLYSHSASLHATQVYKWVLANLIGTLRIYDDDGEDNTL